MFPTGDCMLNEFLAGLATGPGQVPTGHHLLNELVARGRQGSMRLYWNINEPVKKSAGYGLARVERLRFASRLS